MPAAFVGRGLTVHGAWHWNHLKHSDKMIKTIRGAKPMLDKIITHRFPMTKVKEAWDLQLMGRCGKIILHPWEKELEPARKFRYNERSALERVN